VTYLSLPSTGRTPREPSPARLARAVVDPVQLRADLIAAGVIVERVQTLRPSPLPDGAVVCRLTVRDKQIAAARVAQALAEPRRWRDHLDREGRWPA